MNVFYSYLFILYFLFFSFSFFFQLFRLFFIVFCATRHRRLRWVSLSCLAIVSYVLSECASVCEWVVCLCVWVYQLCVYVKQTVFFLRASLKFLETRPLRMFSNYKQFQCSSSARKWQIVAIVIVFLFFISFFALPNKSYTHIHAIITG